jgi:hypothetical protein
LGHPLFAQPSDSHRTFLGAPPPPPSPPSHHTPGHTTHSPRTHVTKDHAVQPISISRLQAACCGWLRRVRHCALYQHVPRRGSFSWQAAHGGQGQARQDCPPSCDQSRVRDAIDTLTCWRSSHQGLRRVRTRVVWKHQGARQSHGREEAQVNCQAGRSSQAQTGCKHRTHALALAKHDHQHRIRALAKHQHRTRQGQFSGRRRASSGGACDDNPHATVTRV